MKPLIVYYSWSGMARKTAQAIAEVTGGRLCQIKPKIAYTADYGKVVKQAKEELSKGYLPEIEKIEDDVSAYDTVFIGTPNWWSSVAPPVQTFLRGNDFAGKTIYPFVTHGGGGGGHIERDIRALCRGAHVKPALVVYEGQTDGAVIKNWIN